MRSLIEKSGKLNFGWNERPLTEADFYRLCRRFRIKVTEMPLSSGGFYYRLMGGDFIAVDSRLSGPAKLAVLFHELAHYLFHTPESGATANFHHTGRRTRAEIEADAFALCALIPRRWLETRTSDELINEDGFSPDIVAARVELFRRSNF